MDESTLNAEVNLLSGAQRQFVQKEKNQKRWNIRRALDYVVVELKNGLAREKLFAELLNKFKQYISAERDADHPPQEWRINRLAEDESQYHEPRFLQQAERILLEACAAIVSSVDFVLNKHNVTGSVRNKITGALTPESLSQAYNKAIAQKPDSVLNIPWKAKSVSVSCLRHLTVLNLLLGMSVAAQQDLHSDAVWCELETALLGLEVLTSLTGVRQQRTERVHRRGTFASELFPPHQYRPSAPAVVSNTDADPGRAFPVTILPRPSAPAVVSNTDADPGRAFPVAILPRPSAPFHVSNDILPVAEAIPVVEAVEVTVVPASSITEITEDKSCLPDAGNFSP